MHARQDVQSLLASPATEPQLALQLETARQILTFAESSLDLPANGSYASYVELDSDALVWNVVATEAFSLQPKKWCFVIAGCLPYRGFFKLKKALQSADRLRRKDMDVYLTGAAAYSTLGKFKDPLLSSMFSSSDAGIAAFLFHELAHQRVYIKGDGQFNESYAAFMEETGVKIWLESTGQYAELQQWQTLQLASKAFNALISETRKRLTILYGSNSSDADKRREKTAILQAMVQSYDRLRAKEWGGRDYFSNWFSEPVNNAKLALYNTYEGGHCAFRNLLIQAGEDMPAFNRQVQAQAKLANDKRREWLKQSCASIQFTGES